MITLFSLYFGHPVNTYGTALESELIKKREEIFPVHNIENPNQKKHSEGYKEKGMDYFFKFVLPNCDAGIFLTFRDGKWGAGVGKEAKWMLENGKKIWKINHNGDPSYLNNIPDSNILSVEETRERIRQNGKILPY